jgi:hypothetical protein
VCQVFAAWVPGMRTSDTRENLLGKTETFSSVTISNIHVFHFSNKNSVRGKVTGNQCY